MVKLLGSRCFSKKTGRIIPEQVAELIRIRIVVNEQYFSHRAPRLCEILHNLWDRAKLAQKNQLVTFFEIFFTKFCEKKRKSWFDAKIGCGKFF